MSDVNRSSVRINLRDVQGKALTDHVQLKFYNQRAQSLNQVFEVDLAGQPRTLSKVPAFPFGLAEVFINPTRYRFKSIFVNVPAGRTISIEETFFITPELAKPSFPSFSNIQTGSRWGELRRILPLSGITSASSWNQMDDFEKAGLFNLYAKMQQEIVSDGRPVVTFIERVAKFKPERIYARVAADLYDLVKGYAKGFHPVSGALHKFPAGWKVVDPDGSFKTYHKAGNLQITFAKNDAGGLMADIDIDDHQGLAHAADVLKHKITGKDTNPYDIHQILVHFQGLDPGYELN